jgi:hypothetical protein
MKKITYTKLVFALVLLGAVTLLVLLGEDTIPIQGENALPVQGDDALPVQSENALPVQTELKNGDALHFGTGSKISMEVSPGFWIDTPIQANQGLVIGEAQADNSIDAPFDLLAQATQHLSSAPVVVVEADANSAKLDFSSWAMNWGDAVIPLGSGGSDEHGEGVAVVKCESSCKEGKSFTLDYSATIPAGAGILGGMAYRLHMMGKIE